MLGLSRLWNLFSTGQNEDDTETSADSENDYFQEDDDDEQSDEQIELNVTVEQITISSGDEK
jgi:hypothetical protein